MAVEHQKSLDQLLGQAMAERAREEGQAEVTYELGDEKHGTRTPSFRDDDDPGSTSTEPLGSLELERRATRSAVKLGLAFLLLCSGHHLLQGLQTSLFARAGLWALLATHGAAALSCLLAPPLALSARGAVAALGAAACLQQASFLFYSEAGLVAGGLVVGLALGPAWCAAAAHLSAGAARVPRGTPRIRDAAQRRLLKAFCALAGSGRLWTNLVASLVARFDDNDAPNGTEAVKPSFGQCEDESRTPPFQFGSLDSGSVRTLVAIYSSCALAGALLVLVFLERAEPLQSQDPMERHPALQALRQIRLVLADGKIRLCIPLIVFTGIEQGFIMADFTRSYVSCSLGLESVAPTMACLGGCGALGCVAVHLFAEHFQRPVALAAATVCQCGLLLVLVLWTPARDDAPVLYVVAGGWGLCHAVWDTLLTTFFASTYLDDWQVPFTVLHLLQSCGTVLALAACRLLPLGARVCLLAAALAASVVPHTVLEFRLLHRSTMHGRKAVL